MEDMEKQIKEMVVKLIVAADDGKGSMQCGIFFPAVFEIYIKVSILATKEYTELLIDMTRKWMDKIETKLNDKD